MEYRSEATISSVTTSQLGEAWKAIVEERGKELEHAIYVEYGLAEEVISLMTFKDGSYEVGIGESLRPYDQLYVGTSLEEATKHFLTAVREHTWFEDDNETT